MESQINLKIL